MSAGITTTPSNIPTTSLSMSGMRGNMFSMPRDRSASNDETLDPVCNLETPNRKQPHGSANVFQIADACRNHIRSS